MYVIDATHFLNEKGAIGPQSGPARELAEFLGSVIVAATYHGPREAPHCFKCGEEVQVDGNADATVAWYCTGCGEEGTISNWGGTLWDMSGRAAPTAPAAH